MGAERSGKHPGSLQLIRSRLKQVHLSSSRRRQVWLKCSLGPPLRTPPDRSVRLLLAGRDAIGFPQRSLGEIHSNFAPRASNDFAQLLDEIPDEFVGRSCSPRLHYR